MAVVYRLLNCPISKTVMALARRIVPRLSVP